jgi:hypothetical protein
MEIVIQHAAVGLKKIYEKRRKGKKGPLDFIQYIHVQVKMLGPFGEGAV